MTENIMIQETEMTKTGFCEMCGAQSELEKCMNCGEAVCFECRVDYECNASGKYCECADCFAESHWDGEEDDDDWEDDDE